MTIIKTQEIVSFFLKREYEQFIGKKPFDAITITVENGQSTLVTPKNFGVEAPFYNLRDIVLRAYDCKNCRIRKEGITQYHFNFTDVIERKIDIIHDGSDKPAMMKFLINMDKHTFIIEVSITTKGISKGHRATPRAFDTLSQKERVTLVEASRELSRQIIKEGKIMQQPQEKQELSGKYGNLIWDRRSSTWEDALHVAQAA